MLKISSESTLRGTMHIIEAGAEMVSAVYKAAMHQGHDTEAAEGAAHVWCSDDELSGVMQSAWAQVLDGEPELLAA